MDLRSNLITEISESFGVKLRSIIYSDCLRYPEATVLGLARSWGGHLSRR
jgi:hypothetical protein